MALLIPRNIIKRENALQIKKDLNVYPKETTFYSKKYRKVMTTHKDPITVYSVYNHNKLGECVAMPYVFAKNMFDRTNDDFKHKSIRIKWDGTLRPNQKPIIKDIKNMLYNENVALLHLMPGTGKTCMSIYMITRIKLLTVIIVRDKTLLKQWIASIEKYTRRHNIVVVGDKGWQNKKANIYICLHRRWDKLSTDIRSRVGLVIIDELHLFCNKTGVEAILAFPCAKHYIGCTATPTRSRSGLDTILDYMFGENRVTTEHNLNITMLKLETDFRSGCSDSWLEVYKGLIYKKRRNKKIVKLAALLVEYGHKPMLVTNEKEHVELLHSMLIEEEVNADYIHGDKPNYNDCDVLVGNMQKCGTGFDEESYCTDFGGKRIDVVILCCSIGNVEGLEQILGRSFRADHPIIIYLVDNEKMIVKHWNLAVKWAYSLNDTKKDKTEDACNIIETDWDEIENVLPEL